MVNSSSLKAKEEDKTKIEKIIILVILRYLAILFTSFFILCFSFYTPSSLKSSDSGFSYLDNALKICYIFNIIEEVTKTKQELERTRTELAILYEISNAMRTTLKLDEILYIILTGVTAHIGLGFNRAILFLVNEKDGLIEGKMGIGPESGEEANRIWTRVEQEQMDLDDLISAYKVSSPMIDSGFNQQIRSLKIPLKEQNGGLLALGVLDGMPLHLTKETIQNYNQDPLIQLLKTEELAIVPLKAKDKVNGIILADNFITRKPINKDDLRM